MAEAETTLPLDHLVGPNMAAAAGEIDMPTEKVVDGQHERGNSEREKRRSSSPTSSRRTLA